MNYQSTIGKEVSISGVGLHTGKEVTLTFKPAPANHGYKFKRIDLPNTPVVSADVSKVIKTNRGTTIQQGEASISTVEHALAALAGLQLDNVLIEIDGPEVPIMDTRGWVTGCCSNPKTCKSVRFHCSTCSRRLCRSVRRSALVRITCCRPLRAIVATACSITSGS